MEVCRRDEDEVLRFTWICRRLAIQLDNLFKYSNVQYFRCDLLNLIFLTSILYIMFYDNISILFFDDSST